MIFFSSCREFQCKGMAWVCVYKCVCVCRYGPGTCVCMCVYVYRFVYMGVHVCGCVFMPITSAFYW